MPTLPARRSTLELDAHRVPHDDWKYRNIVHISHGDLFRALDLEQRGLARLKSRVKKQDWTAAYAEWDHYICKGKQHLDVFDPPAFRRLMRGKDNEADYYRKKAKEIYNHQIQWYGPRVEQFGDIVNFSPGKDRSALYGFHYWYWAEPLIYAYVLDRDSRYAEAFDGLFNQWYDQRDSVEWRIPRLDPIWYELGLCRTNRFIAFYSLFKNEQALQPSTRERLLRTLLGHGRALYGFVNGTKTGGNFQFNSTLALTHLALAMPEFKESKRWIRESLRTIRSLLEHAMYEDGGFNERCPSYASFSLGFSTEIYRLLEDRPEHSRARSDIGRLLRRGYRWYMYMATPLGEFPPFGDARTRSALKMLSAGIHALDLDDLFATLHPSLARVTREKLYHQYGHRSREIDLSRRKINPDALPENPSAHFQDSHWSIMRSSWKPTAHYMAINHGPIAGHAHQEALSFNCYAFGEPQALELDLAVTMGYDDDRCGFCRSSRSHNMVVLDDESIEQTWNPMDLWTGQDVVWHSDPSLDYFQACHRGYSRNKSAIVARKILFVKPHFWIVHDRVTLERRGKAKSSSWYLHACNRFRKRADGWVAHGTRSRLNVIPLESTRGVRARTSLESRLKVSDMEDPPPLRNYYPERYFLSLSKRLGDRKSVDHCVLLYPQRKADQSRVSVESLQVRQEGKRVSQKDAAAWRISRGKERYVVMINHLDPDTTLTVDGQEIRGRVAAFKVWETIIRN